MTAVQDHDLPNIDLHQTPTLSVLVSFVNKAQPYAMLRL